MRPLFLLLAGLLAAPASGQAQSATPASAPRWYLSAGITYQRVNGLSYGPDQGPFGGATFLGPLVRVGWRLNARTSLALGFGASYRGWHQQLYRGLSIPEACPYWQVRTASFMLPLQIQSQLLKRASRWGLEAQAGVVLVQRYSDVELAGDFCQPLPNGPVRSGFRSSKFDLPVLVGLALTRQLGTRWQAVAQAQAALTFRYLFDEYGGSFEDALPGMGGSLGVRYSL